MTCQCELIVLKTPWVILQPKRFEFFFFLFSPDLSINPMSTLIKNGIPHPKFGSGEIIQTTSELISDSGQDICTDHLHSSEESLDSCEEKGSFQQNNKKRTKLKVRSISDSTDEEVIWARITPSSELFYECSQYLLFVKLGTPETSYKGILKYRNRRLRSLSESCAESYRYYECSFV